MSKEHRSGAKCMTNVNFLEVSELFNLRPFIHSEVLMKCSLLPGIMQSRALSGYGPCSHGAHGPDLGEVLSLSKMLAQETAAESATFPKIAKSSARNQRKKVVENCELRGLENLYSSTAHFGSGGYG